MICLKEKEPSRKRKVKNALAKCLVRNFRSRGEKVWKRLNAQLPAPVGSHTTDEPRVKQFEELVKKLSFTDHYALKRWLKFAYNEMDNSCYGDVTGSIERHCTKWTQIYSEHYNVME